MRFLSLRRGLTFQVLLCILWFGLQADCSEVLAQQGTLGVESSTAASLGISPLNSPRAGLSLKGYTLVSAEIDGRVTDDDNANGTKTAEMTIVFTVRLFAPEMQTIPLRLQNCILVEEPVFSDDDVGQTLDFDESQGGYLWLIEDPAVSLQVPRLFKLTLKLKQTVTEFDQAYDLQLRVPSALTSQLSLLVPEKSITAITHRAREPEIEEQADGTILTMKDLDGDISVRWKRKSDVADTESYLVESEVTTSIDPILRRVRYEGEFKVRGSSLSGKSLRVRIPAGTNIVSSTPRMPSGDLAEPGEDERTLEFALSEDDPIRVVVEGEFSDLDEIALGYFGVESVASHSGLWQITCTEGWRISPRFVPAGLVQIDAGDVPREAGALQRSTSTPVPTFRFLQDSEPLRVQVFRPQLVASARPTSSVFCAAESLELDASYVINVTSGRLFELAIDTHGWTIDEVWIGEEESLLLGDFYNDVLHLPLDRPLTGQTRLHFTATMARQNATAVEFQLPSLDDVGMREGVLEVLADDDWECVPETSRLQGLTAIEIIESDGMTFETQGAVSRYYGLLRPLTQDQVASVVQVSREGNGVRVEQILTTTSAQAMSLNNFRLLVPASLWEQRQARALTFRRANQELTPVVVDDHGGGRDAQFTGVAIALTPQREGDKAIGTQGEESTPIGTDSFNENEITVAYRLSPLADGESAERLSVDLVVPLTSPFAGHTVTFQSGDEQSIQLRPMQSGWQPVASAEGEEMPGSYATAQPLTSISLLASKQREQKRPRAVIPEVVIHTWLGHEFREDRVMFLWQPTAVDEQLTVQLPGEISSEVLVRQNGEALAVPAIDEHNRVVLTAHELNGKKQPASIPVELIYRLPYTSAVGSRLDGPRFSDDVSILHTYWQTTLPAGEHLLWTQGEVQSESDWVWRGGWQRVPRVGLPELERRVHAATTPALPAAVNQYLFSVTGPPGELEVVTAPRSAIVGVVSMVVLGLGIALLSFPRIRQAWVLLAVLVVALGLLIALPSLAPLLIQAGLLGGALLAGSAVLRWALNDPAKAGKPRRAPGDESRSEGSRSRSGGTTDSTLIRTLSSPSSNR